jgi:S-adenosylmethionine-diacylgycerolhomoserine-N-methlytransferase
MEAFTLPILSDLKILWKMVFPRARGATHGERLDGFYRDQAEGYDDFRRRLLHGREPMIRSLDIPAGARLLDMGGGTGSNFEYFENIENFESLTIVDLSTALLDVARKRIERHGWKNVRSVLADATAYQPEEPVDVITFSYSLTMIPEWRRAIDHAWDLLKPGGQIGVADFYVSPRHWAIRRAYWRFMFGWDNVWVSPEHLSYLQSKFAPVLVEERQGRVPYMLGLQAPFYVFIGRKPA